jgi:DNA-binding response OmpR family regulator
MPKPIIVVTGNPPWKDQIAEWLASDYDVEVYDDRAGYVTRLADSRAALVLVDGRDPDWSYWTTTPKSSPATRRIPIIVITDEAAARRAALLAGADLVLAPDELAAQLDALVRDYARVVTPEYQEALDCGCQEPLPPLAVQGVEKFNAGEY